MPEVGLIIIGLAIGVFAGFALDHLNRKTSDVKRLIV
jgi:hypothetical protein